jgi:cytochrome c556
MNLRFLIPVLALLSFSVPAVAADVDTPLDTAMKHMSSAYKELSFDLQQPHDAGKAHYLALTAKLKTEAEVSRGLVPQKAATLPPGQRAAMVQAYQKRMGDLIQWIDSLTQDIQKSEWDDARKVMAALKQQMTYGHKDFRLKN